MLILRHLIRRLLVAAATALAAITITWGLIRLAPGSFYAGEKTLPPGVERNLREKYGLGDPPHAQYAKVIRNAAAFDFGDSLAYRGRPVAEIIKSALPVSAAVGGLSYLVALAAGLFAGVISSLRRGSTADHAVNGLALLGVSVPTFVLGPALVLLFSQTLNWLPPARWAGLASTNLVLPVLTLSVAYMAYFARLARSGMTEALRADYVRTARAKGLPEHKVVLKHALRTGVIPVVSFSGPALAFLLTGTVVVERVFALPGLGAYFVNASLNRDEPLILGIVAVTSVIVLALNLLVDAAYSLLDPRVRA